MGRRPNPLRFVYLTEEQREVGAGDLSRLGIFDGVSRDHIVVANFGGLTLKFRFDSYSNILHVQFPKKRGGMTQIIEVSTTKLKFGVRYYFICPDTRRRCAKLYIGGGRLIGRERTSSTYGSRGDAETRWQAKAMRLTDRLHGHNNKGPARGRNKARIIEQLKALGRTDELTRDTQQIMFAPESLPRPKPLAPNQMSLTNNMGTEAAHERQRRKSYISPSIVASILYPHVERAQSTTFKPAAAEPLDGAIAKLGGFGCLSIRELVRMCPEDDDDVWFGAFAWPGTGDHVYLAVDRTSEKRSFIWIRVYAPGSASYLDQFVPLVHSSHRYRRWYMLCPVTGQRVEHLYVRNGRFASAPAQRLIHRSQRVRA